MAVPSLSPLQCLKHILFFLSSASLKPHEDAELIKAFIKHNTSSFIEKYLLLSSIQMRKFRCLSGIFYCHNPDNMVLPPQQGDRQAEPHEMFPIMISGNPKMTLGVQ